MGDCQFHSNWKGEVEKAIREWLRMEKPCFYRHGISILVARYDKCTTVLGEYDESERSRSAARALRVDTLPKPDHERTLT